MKSFDSFVRRFTTPALSLAALIALSASCSGDDAADKRAKPSVESRPDWAVHIYAGVGAARRRIDVGAVPELSFPAGVGAPSAGSLPDSPGDVWKAKPKLTLGQKTSGATPGSKPQAVVGGPDGGIEFDQKLDDPSGWALVWGAAMECGFGGARLGGGGPNPFLDTPIVPPWDSYGPGYAWSIFPAAPKSCDQEVAYSEALLCTANELAKVADAIAPITWNGVGSSAPFTGFPSGPWSIPVQSNKDRFILRDLSIYLLANLALTDMKVPTNGGTNSETCSAVYARALTDSTFATDPTKAGWLFGVAPGSPAQYFPPMDSTLRVVSPTNLPGSGPWPTCITATRCVA